MRMCVFFWCWCGVLRQRTRNSDEPYRVSRAGRRKCSRSVRRGRTWTTGMCSCLMRNSRIRSRWCILIRYSRRRRCVFLRFTPFRIRSLLKPLDSFPPFIFIGGRNNPHAQRHRRRPQAPPRRGHSPAHESEETDAPRADRERDGASGPETFRSQRRDDQGTDRESDRGGVCEEGRGGYGALYLCCVSLGGGWMGQLGRICFLLYS